MNSYNENLHANVVTSLQNLQQEIKSSQAQRDAAMFSLYYAEGAQISAAENLDAANQMHAFQQTVKEQAVNNSNISNNLLTSANQQKNYTAQATTNTAVNASNVQIASNAIVRLASDIGSIFSILKAADFDTEIYSQGEEAYKLMSKTAYDAEKTSQSAMEASTVTAAISAATVADEAQATNTVVANLLGIVAADYDTISANVTNDNAALAAASSTEKQAEGVLEFVNASFFAANHAYVLNNKELNLDLCVPQSGMTADSYIVTFSYYQSPFVLSETNVRVKPTTIEDLFPVNYPVKKYYVMLVKENQQAVFTMADAEGLLLDHSRYVEVPAKLIGSKRASVEILISQLLDSDGDPMDVGSNYVIFVLAELMDDYKKAINDFDDYLSAPSAVFKLTNSLVAPDSKIIEVDPETNILSFAIDQKTKIIKNAESDGDEEEAASNDESGIEYRCMFLPDNRDLIKGLLSNGDLRTIEKEVEKLEKIADEFDPKILELKSQINTLTATLQALNQQLAELKAKPKDKKTEEEIKEVTKKIADTSKELKDDKHKLKTVWAQMMAAMKAIDPVKDTVPGFFFNLKIAEQVPRANYTVAKPQHQIKESKSVYFEASITDSTTDNFGTQLIPGKKYIPVVLTVSTASEDEADQYTSALSGHGKQFTYSLLEEVIQ